MKLTTNKSQFVKMKWFFSLFLGIIISLFFVLPVKATDIRICVPAKDQCYKHTGEDSKCVNTANCHHVFRSVTIGDSYPKSYKFCASLSDPKKCYNFSASNCPKTDCELINFTLPTVSGNANPVDTKGNADTATYSKEITNPLGKGTTLSNVVAKAINSVMGIIGALALLMFVYGGLIWMTSSGNQEKVKKGRDVMTWAAVGLVIIFSAYGLTKFIINIVTK